MALSGNETGGQFTYSYNVLNTVTKDWTQDYGTQTCTWRSKGQCEDISVQFPHIIILTTTTSIINKTMTKIGIIFEGLLGSSFYVW